MFDGGIVNRGFGSKNEIITTDRKPNLTGKRTQENCFGDERR
jgi:hypothetical protein